MFKKINPTILSIALILHLIISYISPFREVTSHYVAIGYPLKWLKIYNTFAGNSFFGMSNIDALALIINIIILYYISKYTYLLFYKLKKARH